MKFDLTLLVKSKSSLVLTDPQSFYQSQTMMVRSRMFIGSWYHLEYKGHKSVECLLSHCHFHLTANVYSTSILPSSNAHKNARSWSNIRLPDPAIKLVEPFLMCRLPIRW
jgi:hypothetical protein